MLTVVAVGGSDSNRAAKFMDEDGEPGEINPLLTLRLRSYGPVNRATIAGLISRDCEDECVVGDHAPLPSTTPPKLPPFPLS